MTPNLLTIDVEDWFHLLDVPVRGFEPDRWGSLPSRVERNTLRLLDRLEEHAAGATFYVLGWVAEHHPRLVRAISDRGFEVGVHGHRHLLVHRLQPHEFTEDLDRSIAAVSDATGAAVEGFRAPGFSITASCTWAFEELAARGFAHDSSVFPGQHGHGGMATRRRAPYTLVTKAGDLAELPLATVDVLGRAISVGGGGYMRLLPGPVMRGAIRYMNRSGTPATIYLHPREIDPEQPRMPGLPLARRFKSYVNLGSTEEKLVAMLRAFRFTSVRSWLTTPEAQRMLASRERP